LLYYDYTWNHISSIYCAYSLGAKEIEISIFGSS
jgi:hypothetical protein